MIDPAELARFNAGVRMARAAYYVDPNPCRDWCPDCIRPRGTTKDCTRCKDVRRLRARRKESK